jgi:hypothetical protein
MIAPILPEPERLEAFKRLLAMLTAAPGNETLSLATMMLAEILHAHRIEPESDRWHGFFKVLANDVAKEMVGINDQPLH